MVGEEVGVGVVSGSRSRSRIFEYLFHSPLQPLFQIKRSLASHQTETDSRPTPLSARKHTQTKFPLHITYIYISHNIILILFCFPIVLLI
jgi:hypothetical protein